MAQEKNSTDLRELLFQFMGTSDLMLSMLEWLCREMMEVEVSAQSKVFLMQVVQETFVQGVSTRRMEELAQSLGYQRYLAKSSQWNDQGVERTGRGVSYPSSYVSCLSRVMGRCAIRKSQIWR